jgi:hypothetical protein
MKNWMFVVGFVVTSLLAAGNVSSSAGKFSHWVVEISKKYPEVSWLANSAVHATSEGIAESQGSYSAQLYGQQFIEFDRTMMTLHCLQLILDGSKASYEQFTQDQPVHAKLSWESFQELHKEGVELLKSDPEMRLAMEAALILGDIGKTEFAHKIFAPYSIDDPDHDNFFEKVMDFLQEHPELSSKLLPTFAKLNGRAKELIYLSTKIGHQGHMAHIEGGPSMYTPLKQSGLASKDPIALRFGRLIHKCDVAGALGHRNNHSSLVYTEETHWVKKGIDAAMDLLAKPEPTEMQCYNAYLDYRGKPLGLNSKDAKDRVLIRLAAMLRITQPADVPALQKAFAALSNDDQERIAEQLACQDLGDNIPTPTYMPAVLVNFSTKEKAIALGLPLIARVLEKYAADVQSGKIKNREIPLSFRLLGEEVKKRPEAFANATFTFNENHEVILEVTSAAL